MESVEEEEQPPAVRRSASQKAMRRQASASRVTLDNVLGHLKRLEEAKQPHFVYVAFVHHPGAAQPAEVWRMLDDYQAHMRQLSNARVLRAEAISPERLSNELFQHGNTLAIILRLYGHIRGLRRSVYVRREVVEADVPRRQNLLFWMLDGVVGVARQEFVQYLIVVAPVVRDLRRLMFRQMLDLISLDSVDSGGGGGGEEEERNLRSMFSFHKAILDYVGGSSSRRAAVAKAARALHNKEAPSSSSSDYDSAEEEEDDDDDAFASSSGAT